MSSAPKLTNRAALLRNRARARQSRDAALFLHDDIRREIEERLSEVNRSFTAPAVITGFPEIWQDFMPETTIVADDETLALRPGAHDLVIHALALHWANDPVGQLIQARRALRPDGLFLGVLFGGRTLHELRGALAEAEAEVSGGLSPRIAPMAEIRDLGALLQRAGFALPVADSAMRTATYASPFHLMRDLRAMGETSALAERPRRFSPRAVFLRAAALYESAFAQPDGRLPASFETVTLTGWAPADNQPKPLRPGAALTRLSEALGTKEHPLDPGQRD